MGGKILADWNEALYKTSSGVNLAQIFNNQARIALLWVKTIANPETRGLVKRMLGVLFYHTQCHSFLLV
jgi:hypothetical protein